MRHHTVPKRHNALPVGNNAALKGFNAVPAVEDNAPGHKIFEACRASLIKVYIVRD